MPFAQIPQYGFSVIETKDPVWIAYIQMPHFEGVYLAVSIVMAETEEKAREEFEKLGAVVLMNRITTLAERTAETLKEQPSNWTDTYKEANE